MSKCGTIQTSGNLAGLRFFWLVSILLACATSGELLAQDVEITPNIVYGNKAGLAKTMDMYRPTDANGSVVMWIISGGGRSRWEAKHYRLNSDGSARLASDEELVAAPSIRWLLTAGFTVFGVHHGSAPVFPFTEHVDDIRDAVRFLRINAERYEINPERIGLWGGSGGGLLALLVSTTSDEGQRGEEGSAAQVSSRVAAVVSYFAPTDLGRHIAARPSDQLPLYRQLFPDSDAYEALSPLNHVSSDDPPILFVHGDADLAVNPIEGQSMSEALELQGVDTQFIVIPGAGHGFVGSDAERADEAALRWFQRHLAP